VTDEASFSASTVGAGPTLGNTQLFLFADSGLGVVANDDEPGGSMRSRIDSTHVVADGCYFLVVSGANRDPTNNGAPIFPDSILGQMLPLPGRGPMNGAAGSAETGSYLIRLTGCEFVPTTMVEFGDAGDLPSTAQAPAKVGPLTRITGSLAASDVDMFVIKVVSPATFSVSCCANTPFDSQLFLFDDRGLGVAANDDDCGLNSRIDTTLVRTVGLHYLAISRFDRDPLSAGGPIFTGGPQGQLRPNGPGGSQPVATWLGSSAGPVAYEIRLTGCSFAAAASAVDYGVGAGSQHGVPSLTTTFPPQLGNQTDLVFTNPDPTAVVFGLALGLRRAALPFAHGRILVADLATVVTFPAPMVGANRIGPFNMPGNLEFNGQRVTWQVVVAVAPSSGFPNGMTLTNGTEWTFGL
jgi:hypothetical protein